MFKYYSIPTDDLVDKIIGETPTIKLSSAFTLNDPYELKFNLEIDPFEDGHLEVFLKNYPDKTEDDFKDWQNHVNSHDGFAWFIEQQNRDAIAQKVSLCSFSNENNSNLMWSHYTNNHEGMCVEYSSELFDFLENRKGFVMAQNVNYSEEPPVLNGLENLTERTEKTLFNKQIEWSYEREFRVVYLSDADQEFIPIETRFIKAVYMGARVKPSMKKQIISICEKLNSDCYHGITLGKTYKVQFRKNDNNFLFPTAFWN